MSVTYTQARDLIFGAVDAAWTANMATIFGGERELRFASIEQRDPPANDKAWGYCDALITDTRQIGLRNDATRRYKTVGVLTVDVYAPRQEVNAAIAALDMGNAIKKSLEKPHHNGIWFRHVTAHPSRNTAGFAVVRVVADFIYTEEGESDG